MERNIIKKLIEWKQSENLCEDAPDYHVAVAGSLLGVSLHSGVSFPVGKVDMLKYLLA